LPRAWGRSPVGARRAALGTRLGAGDLLVNPTSKDPGTGGRSRLWGDIKHVDAAVPYLTANTSPNDSSWNSTNPRWRPVSALIGRTLRADAEAQFSEAEAAIVENAVRAMSDGVVREDLDAALAFFRSPAGTGFWRCSAPSPI